jgi:hypothetical protein
MPRNNDKSQVTNASTDQIDPGLFSNAIDAGRTIINEGKPKIEAAMAIYRMLEHVDQQTVVGALIEGANLTPMGAVTYWYNCRRKLTKERKQAPQ